MVFTFYTKDFDVSLTSVFSNHIDKFMYEQQDFQRGSEKKYKSDKKNSELDC